MQKKFLTDTANLFKKLPILLLITFGSSFFLAGCSDDKPNKPLIKAQIKKYNKATVLKGSVSDDKQTSLSGEVKVTDEQGNLITIAKLQKNNRFTVEIPAQTTLPIILTFDPDNGSNKLISVAVDPFIKIYEINPRTTAIAEQAKALGGYTVANIMQAANSAVNAPGRNRTSANFRGDPTKQYGGWH